MRSFKLIILSVVVAVSFYACNTEEGLVPAAQDSYIKILKGLGSETPLSIESLSDEFLVVVCNNRITAQGTTNEKIRVLKLGLSGNIVQEFYFPKESEQNWVASKTILLPDNRILIGGTVADSSLIFISLDENLQEITTQTYDIKPHIFSLKGMYYDESANTVLFSGSEVSSDDEFTLYGEMDADNLTIQNTFRSNKARALPSTALFRDVNGRLNWVYNSAAASTLVRSNNIQLNLIEGADFLVFSEASNVVTKSLIGSDEDIMLFGELKKNGKTQLFQYKAFTSAPTVFGASGNNQLNGVKKIEEGYLVSGRTEVAKEGNIPQNDFFLSWRTQNGAEVFAKSFGSEANEQLHDAVIINNKIYAIGSSVIRIDNSLLLIKTNKFGELAN